MNEGKSIFSQLIGFLPDREFRRCVVRYGGDRYTKRLSCWEQYLAMAFAQLTYRESLRDIEACLGAIGPKLYHLGIGAAVARSTLADANETLVRRDSVEGLLALIEECQASYHVPSMHYFGGLEATSVVPASWNDVVMDETATKLLQHDFESFFRRRAWFRANRLPFRRGYLLHGPPGNGKTSVIRAMLSHPGISGFAANLVTLEMDDNVLQAFFKNASENTPALVVLEDIDRLFFGQNNDEKPNVSLQQLLNCLDGVGTQDGMIVVATANHPEVLDTAILRRPGRFDRVIEFGNPSKELRSTYLQKMCPALVGDALDICAIASEGLSFAQLRESYILAGQTAFEEERDVVADDVTNAILLLQATMNKADRKRMQKSGFDLQESAHRKYAR